MQTFIRIHPGDSVAVALQPLAARYCYLGGRKSTHPAGGHPQGHKFALIPIRAGEPVIKYGAPIGTAAADILPGSWVHTANLKTGLGDILDYAYQPSPSLQEARENPARPEDSPCFCGYRGKMAGQE